LPNSDNKLPPLSDEVFDGEKFSVEVKKEKCKHKVWLIENKEIICSKCGAAWSGPHIERLYEQFKQQKRVAKSKE
jgi:uncharacterized protein with PIN domain